MGDGLNGAPGDAASAIDHAAAKSCVTAGGLADAGEDDDATVAAAVRAALAATRATTSRYALAFSGGLDSTVLLHALVQWAGPDAVVALHVAHGLQAAARDWPEWCERQAGALGVAFECLVLTQRPASGDSVEQWARQHRYPALCAAARRHDAAMLLTAHHADDQIETVFIRLGRGAGLDGLLGIEADTNRDGMRVGRPLLTLPREALLRYARHHRLEWIDDPSNDERRFVRNALRHTVLPAFDVAMPGFRRAVLRNHEHWRDAVVILRELAQADLTPARPFGHRLPVLDRRPLLGLTPARRAWALRAWLSGLGLLAPDSARLEQMQRQLLLGTSAQGRVDHQHVCLLRYRDRIVVVARSTVDAGGDLPSRSIHWRGERRIELGAGQGSLRFDAPPNGAGTATSEAGVDGVDGAVGAADVVGPVVTADWLRQQVIQVDFGSLGAHRQRLRAGGPSRPLKNLYQAHGVPGWLRRLLPVCTVGGHVLYSGAFGADQDARWAVAATGSERLVLSWSPPAELEQPLMACGYPWTAPV